MKTVLSPSRGPEFFKSSRSGVALVVVLLCLVLLSILILGFLNTTRVDHASSRLYASGASAKLLSESAVNTVIAQIRQATQSMDAQSGQRVAWASQPGMIRTYNDSGQPAGYYKLYSWDKMVGSGSFDSTSAAETAPSDWYSYKGVFVDLNEPISKEYPIIDGNNLTESLGGQLKTYSGKPVEGFSVKTDDPVVLSSLATNPLPMPVKWLYVLRDGSTVPAQKDSSGTTVAKVPGATVSNPIVGRIAFWADDETCKVNINTASEGTFWSIPLADGRGERSLAINLPVQGEYQRIPGHPATVSLSSVFGGHFKQSNGTNWDPLNSTDASYLQALYGLTPRMKWGGSQGGSKPNLLTAETALSPAYLSYDQSFTPPSPPTGLGLGSNDPSPKGDRLYATIDELLFSQNRPVPNNPLLPADLDQVKFFITANSRAPEVTLFNTPRISIWPITWPDTVNLGATPAPSISANPYFTNTTVPMLMPTEKLLAFCGTVGGDAYYFQRQKSQDATADYANISRNQKIYAYLDNLTTRQVPGFGGNFGSKYGVDRPQILTEIFDFIRSGPDLNNAIADSSAPKGVKTNYNYSPENNRNLGYESAGGSVVPIRITSPGGVSTRGAGRYVAINEVALVFYAADRREPFDGAVPTADPTTWHLINYPSGAGRLISDQVETGAQTTKLGMYLLLNVCNPVTGLITQNAYFVAKITGSPFQINGSSVNFPQSSGNSDTQTLIDYRSNRTDFMNDSNGAFMGSAWTMAAPRDSVDEAKSLSRGAYDWKRYPFYGDLVTVQNTDTTFTFTGGDVTLEIYPADPVTHQAVSNVAATIKLDFSQLNGTYPMPIAPRYLVTGATVAGADTAPTSIPTSAGVKTLSDIAPWEIYNADRYYFSRSNTTTAKDPISGTTYAGPWDMRNLQARAQLTSTGGGVFATGSLSGYNIPLIAGSYGYSGNGADWGPDTVISLRLNADSTKQAGDLRLLAMNPSVPNTWFLPHYAVNTVKMSAPGLPKNRFAHSLALGPNAKSDSFPFPYGFRTQEKFGGLNFASNAPFHNGFSWSGQNTTPIALGGGLTLNPAATVVFGDFNNAYGNTLDGAIIPKPDDTTSTLMKDYDGTIQTPYYAGAINGEITNQPYFSPARQLSGPVVFGSLPTGVLRGIPWQTLAFNPNPAIGSAHPGLASPPDHLLLDLYWMPVVEPYAISEPLSTAGKINLNYQIVPFNYITRQTGLYAAMKSVKITAIPKNAANTYKSMDSASGGGSVANPGGFRFPINIQTTLEDVNSAFQQKFSVQKELFRSASEICSVTLVPKRNVLYNPTGMVFPTTVTATQNWWKVTSPSAAAPGLPVLTGANARQDPYAHLYSLLTTKSNTFQVHYRVQVITHKPQTDAAAELFDEKRGGAVTGEFRGSSIIERYVDPNDPGLPDFASDFTATLDPYYRFRIVSTKAFQP